MKNKIVVSESQHNKIILYENEQKVKFLFDKLEDVKVKLIRVYNKVRQTTMAEFLDGDVDISILKLKVEGYNRDLESHYKSIEAYFNQTPEEVYDEKWAVIHTKLDKVRRTIQYEMVSGLMTLLDRIDEVNEWDNDTDFVKHFRSNNTDR